MSELGVRICDPCPGRVEAKERMNAPREHVLQEGRATVPGHGWWTHTPPRVRKKRKNENSVRVA